MELEQRTFWVEILGQLHIRLRQLAISGLVVLVAIMSDWFFHHQRLAEEQFRITPRLEELVFDTFNEAETSKLAKEIQKALNTPECVVSSMELTQSIKLDCIPSLSSEVSDAETIGTEGKIYGQELPTVLYRIVLIFAPLVLLFGTIVTGNQLRKLHFLLRSEVGILSIQQKLNSPYFARVTTTYGEGRISQILIAAAINLVHVFAVFIYVPAVLIFRNVIQVSAIDGKIMFARIVATGEGLPNTPSLIWASVCLCALALWVVVIVIFARLMVTHRSKGGELKETG